MTTFSGLRVSRLFPVLAALALIAGVLAAVSQMSPAVAAAKPGLRASTTVLIAGETATVSGKMSKKGKRPIVLQALSGKKWKTIASKKTSAAGSFSFAVKPKATTTLRAYAKKATVSGKKRAAVTTKSIKLTVSKQAVTAYTLPGISAYGTSPQASSAAKVVVTSRFTPARPGRAVAMQVQSGSSWKTIATAKQNTLGNAAFKVSSLPSSAIRVVALSSRGAPGFAGGVSKKAWSTNYVTEFSGSSLPAEWKYRLQDQYPGGLRKCSRSTSDMVKISGGVAAISSAKDASAKKPASVCPRGTYRNGHIGTTYETYKVGYGIAAARVKFQEGGGQHSAFWLQSQSGNVGSEIDVAEYFGKGRSDFGLTQFVHYKNSKGQGLTSGSITDKAYQTRTRQALGAKGDDWWKAYHVFSVEWSPSAYIFRVDGVETFRTNKGLTNRQAVLIISSLTSDYEIPRFGGSLAKNTTSVDWVKVWK